MNKPVAWYKKDSNDYLIENIGQPDFQVQEFIDAGYMPLYTHPVKELTDEDCIIPIWLAKNFLESTDVPRFKRILEEAILRKAQ